MKMDASFRNQIQEARWTKCRSGSCKVNAKSKDPLFLAVNHNSKRGPTHMPEVVRLTRAVSFFFSFFSPPMWYCSIPCYTYLPLIPAHLCLRVAVATVHELPLSRNYSCESQIITQLEDFNISSTSDTREETLQTVDLDVSTPVPSSGREVFNGLLPDRD